jgi:hypothetical protein
MRQPDKIWMKGVQKNVVRGFSLVLHDPEGSHYKIWRWRICAINVTNLSPG